MIYIVADRLDRKIVEICSSEKCGCSECSKDDGFYISVALVFKMVLLSGSAYLLLVMGAFKTMILVIQHFIPIPKYLVFDWQP